VPPWQPKCTLNAIRHLHWEIRIFRGKTRYFAIAKEIVMGGVEVTEWMGYNAFPAGIAW
jgi:hypothetical protein